MASRRFHSPRMARAAGLVRGRDLGRGRARKRPRTPSVDCGQRPWTERPVPANRSGRQGDCRSHARSVKPIACSDWPPWGEGAMEPRAHGGLWVQVVNRMGKTILQWRFIPPVTEGVRGRSLVNCIGAPSMAKCRIYLHPWQSVRASEGITSVRPTGWACSSLMATALRYRATWLSPRYLSHVVPRQRRTRFMKR